MGKLLLELKRIRRVSDMMITAHAILNQKYKMLSLISEVLLFACAAGLLMFSFADENVLKVYFTKHYKVIIGLLSLGSFIYSLTAVFLDWKVRSARHGFAFEKYMDIKFKCSAIVDRIESNDDTCTQAEVERFFERYYSITPGIISIPEKEFLKCKKRHKMKVFISKCLDDNPGISLWLLNVKIYWRDNCKKLK